MKTWSLRKRIFVAAAALVYLAIGGWLVLVVRQPVDDTSDLAVLGPYFDGVLIGIWLAGAALLLRLARGRRSWPTLLVPLLFFPASMVGWIAVLVVAAMSRG